MAKKEDKTPQAKIVPSLLVGGMNNDSTLLTQKGEQMLFMLNGTEETTQGDVNSVSNYESNALSFDLPKTQTVIGKTYMSGGEIALFMKDTASNQDVIAIFYTKEEQLVEYVRSNKFLFDEKYPIDAVFRLRRGCERTIYFTDNLNPPRYYNFDRPEIFENKQGEFDIKLTNLINTSFIIPRFNPFKLTERGQLPAGAVVIGVQYVDNDENISPVVTLSKKIEIYSSSIEKPFSSIEGSSSINNLFFDKEETSKAIEISFEEGTLDTSYEYYRLVFVHYENGDNMISKVYQSNNIPISQTIFTYTGKNVLGTIDQNEIQQEPILISKAKNILAYENRLLLSNVTENLTDYCEFQKAASKIIANCVHKTYSPFDMQDPACPKKPNHDTGYMPGDIYSFGIVYVFENGHRTPVYHIPGKPANDDGQSNMALDNTCTSTKYTNIKRNACNSDFWGVDYMGNTLQDSAVRHHRFPTRDDLGIPFITQNATSEIGKHLYSSFNMVLDYDTNVGSNAYLNEIRDNADEVKIEIGLLPPALHYLIYYTASIKRSNGDNWFVDDTNKGKWSINMDYTLEVGHVFTTASLRNAAIKFFKDGEEFDRIYMGETLIPFQEENQNLYPDNHATGTPIPNCYFTLKGRVGEEESSENKTVRATMLGIKFSNIEIPNITAPDGSKIIGYEIVRQERTKENRNILDTGFLTPAFKNNEYYAIGTWNVNYGTLYSDEIPNLSTLTTETILENRDKLPEFKGRGLVNSITGLWHPTFFYNKEEYINTKKLRTLGYYSRRDAINPGKIKVYKKWKEVDGNIVPFNKIEEGALFEKETIVKEAINIIDTPNKHRNSLAVLTDTTSDVQEGTTYNPKVDKTEDKDGFRLRYMIREGAVTYLPVTVPMAQREIEITDINYLNAVSNYTTKEGSVEGKNVYNITSDSKMGYIVPKDLRDTNLALMYNNIPYIALTQDLTEYYTDFREAPFYKETNNYFKISPGVLNTTEDIYSGDIHLGEVRPAHSVYYDIIAANRTKKRSIWKIVLGAVLAVAGAALAIFTGGASAVAAGLAIASLGLSMAAAGIKHENMLKLYERDWDLGVRAAFEDHNFSGTGMMLPNTSLPDLISAIVMLLDTSLLGKFAFKDDEIRYFVDGVNTLYYETTINTYLRHQAKDDIDSFINTQSDLLKVRRYGFDKLTVFNKDRDSLRGLRPVPYPELYTFNPDYTPTNYGKKLFQLPYTYDCCSVCGEEFPHRVYYSEQSFQEELLDNYKVFKPNNYRDISGETGQINNMFVFKQKLCLHTEDSLWILPSAHQERVTGDILTYVGTGDFFGVPPQSVIDADSGNSYGIQHKWSATLFPNGYLFVNENQKRVILFNGQFTDLNKFGYDNWLKRNIPTHEDILFNDNPYIRFGAGYLTYYSPKDEKLFVTKKDYTLSETLRSTLQEHFVNGFTFYGSDDYKIYLSKKEGAQSFMQEVPYSAEDVQHKDWTISFDLKKNVWRSFHSFTPNIYLCAYDKIFSIDTRFTGIWKHNVLGDYQSYYGTREPFIIEFIVTPNMFYNTVYDYLKFYTEAFIYEDGQFKEMPFITFNKAILSTAEDTTGELTLVPQIFDETYFFSQAIKDLSPSEVYLNRKEGDWYFNEIRNYREDYSKPLLVKTENPIEEYKINTDILNYDKSWEDVDMLKGKYLRVRLIFHNTRSSYKLLHHFTITNYSNNLR